ncbi:MAG: hypothetical protein IJJ69_04085 [Oscillospiraceae bacterium]|nr:hypothetical protein [Oscillospiraceae bacterium]
MIYADYPYYTESFGGSVIPEPAWNRTAGKASDYLDAATFGRLADGIPEKYADSVRRCECEIAEYLYTYAEALMKAGTGQAGAKSYEQIGAYSVNYASVSDSISALMNGSSAGLDSLIQEIIMKHLGRTGLLYRGLD